MQILLEGKVVKGAAPKIAFGVFDEPIKKWRLADEENRLMHYMIDNGFTLVEGVTVPEDYEDDKYCYENGGFTLVEGWEPHVSDDERITRLETENERLTIENLDSMEIEAELLYELSVLQLGL